jgi:hypothetical protein
MGKFGNMLKGGLSGGLVGAARAGKIGVGDIARKGGLGVMGMLMAKKKAARGAGGMRARPTMEDIMTAEQVPASRAAPIMAGDVDAMMGRSAQNDMAGMKKGGKVSAASAVHKHERAKHKGQPLTKLAKGGSASKRADGCATQGKTKGKFV